VRQIDDHAPGADLRIVRRLGERVDGRDADILLLQSLPPLVAGALGEGAAEEVEDPFAAFAGGGVVGGELLTAKLTAEVFEEPRLVRADGDVA
jgi:hypothetical protein